MLEKKLTEKDFISSYGKACVAIDEMVQQVSLHEFAYQNLLCAHSSCFQGEIEFMDVDTILKMSKLKPLKN